MAIHINLENGDLFEVKKAHKARLGSVELVHAHISPLAWV